MIRRWLVVCLCFALLAGCGAPPAAQSPTAAPAGEASTSAPPAAPATSAPAATADAATTALTITDGAGRELTFEKPPERLVCTYSRCMELLAALELEPVGVTTWEESLLTDPLYFAQPTKTQILTYDGDLPDLEQLAALNPDLVFGWEELADAMAGIAPVYVVANDQDSYIKSHNEIRAFAQLLGRQAIAERNIQRALDRLAAYKALSPQNISVMYGFFSDGKFSYRDGASGTCNLLNEIARCDWPDPANSSSWSVEVGDEGLLQFDPDVLLVDSYGFDDQTDAQIVEALQARPLWAELQAVTNQRLYVSSDATANMDGMGTVGMSRMLDVYAPLLYPDVFPQALTDEEVQEIVGGMAAAQGASTPAQTTYPLTLQDGTGRELTFDKRPERVVALYNENFGMLATLGVEPVGVLANEEMLNDPMYFDGKGASFTPIKAGDAVDAESVAATRPDLILAYSPEEAQLLGAIAPVYLGGDAATVEDLYPSLRRLATILDKTAEAEAAITQFQDRYAAYQQASPQTAGTVLKLAYMDGGMFYVSTVDDPLCRMLAQVATCAWEKATPDEFWGYETTIEGVLELDPDVILLNNWSESSREAMLAGLASNPLWNELRAVQAGRVLGTAGYENPIASSLPAAQKFLDVYMPLLYPDVFPTALTDAQVQEILAR